jgi:hypothetical protein
MGIICPDRGRSGKHKWGREVDIPTQSAFAVAIAMMGLDLRPRATDNFAPLAIRPSAVHSVVRTPISMFN